MLPPHIFIALYLSLVVGEKHVYNIYNTEIHNKIGNILYHARPLHNNFSWYSTSRDILLNRKKTTHTLTHTPKHPGLFMASIGDTIILHMFTHHENGDTRLTFNDPSWPVNYHRVQTFYRTTGDITPYSQMGSFNTLYSPSYTVYSPC